ncbi:hypothetical protein N7481_012460 [Penicillium waksmanii]|uniref:uncharacterized protein n=1 Tax=Penicillium waksmanii TaxID=69791 RepID=UPI002548A9C6|nr:uncharacterized protein N7481_012460 [Penicillium waksmanii]KAJ5965746.1 hypothetical protein N7481_012460 [Penicillium waksmanii]
MTIPAIDPPDNLVSDPDPDPDDDVFVGVVLVAGCEEVDELVVIEEDVVVALGSTLNEFIAADAFLLRR